MKNLKSQPNPEQIGALKEFAKAHGRNWKSKLRTAWETGNYTGIAPHGDTAAYLQQIRNTYGPSWLSRFVLAKDGVSYAVFSAREVSACAWFAYCENDATGTTPHPVLGDVPTCDRCHKFATGQDRVVVPPFATENNQPTAASIANAAAEAETFRREEIAKGPRSWAPEVIADNSGHWAGNGLRFATKAEAEANVQNLSDRWFLVRETRVVESDDKPNYRWVPGTGLVAIENLCPLCGERRGAAGTHKC